MAIESGDRVTFEYIARLTDGIVFDTSRPAVAAESGLVADHPDREYAPLTVDVGEGRIVKGLEDALIGLDEGDETTIAVTPEDGYGEPRDDLIQEFDRAAFGDQLQGAEPEEGLQIQTEDGTLGEVVHVSDSAVRVDFNHELAGEALEFEIEILAVE